MLALILSFVITLLCLSGFLAYALWKRRKQKPSGNQQVNQLSGALKHKEVQSEILIESITDGIIVVDTTGKINLINKAAADMAEWPVDEAMGFDSRVVLRLSDDEQTNQAFGDNEHPFSQVLANRTRLSQTLLLITRGGKKLFVSLVISPVIIPKKDELVGAIAVFRDVSAQKADEQRRADFISTASHEMRTPVAAIEGYLSLALNNNVSKIDAHAREYLEKAHLSTEHLGKLFQDLLTSAKAEDGRLTSHPIVVEIGAFVQQLADDLRFGAQKKGLESEFVSGSHSDNDGATIDASAGSASSMMKTIAPLYFAHVDPDRLREVVTNLFDNAVKYTQRGKVSLSVTGDQTNVQVQVSDTGPGIPAEDLPHLFQKFYRVDNSETRAIGGTGLGLFICRKIIELYGGNIQVQSTVGKGSAFTITLPRLSAARAEQMQLSEKATILA